MKTKKQGANCEEIKNKAVAQNTEKGETATQTTSITTTSFSSQQLKGNGRTQVVSKYMFVHVSVCFTGGFGVAEIIKILVFLTLINQGHGRFQCHFGTGHFGRSVEVQ